MTPIPGGTLIGGLLGAGLFGLLGEEIKEEVSEVKSGFECGIMLENYSDIKVGDIVKIGFPSNLCHFQTGANCQMWCSASHFLLGGG